jgi:hypothetical protein
VYLQDPSELIRVGDNGKYVVYSSHDGLVAHTSLDRIQWSVSKKPAFPNGVPWVADYAKHRNRRDMLEPSIQWVPDRKAADGGKYWMFFAASSDLGSRHSAIGAINLILLRPIKN